MRAARKLIVLLAGVAALSVAGVASASTAPAFRLVAHEPAARITSIACSAATECVAAAQDGTLWTSSSGAQRWRKVGGVALSSSPAAASCAPRGTCVVITAGGKAGAAVRRADGHWRLVDMPRPRQSTSDFAFNDVSCPRSGWCIAVGYASPRGGEPEDRYPVSEVWNGHVWRGKYVAEKHSADTDLVSVSCWAPRGCAAVGDALVCRCTAYAGVAFRLEHGAWSGGRLPRPVSGRTPFPEGIACWAVSRCMISGTVGHTPVGFRLSRHAYRVFASRGPATRNDYVGSIGCHGATDCVMGGTPDESAKAVAPLAAQWDGRAWTRMTVAGSRARDITSIACPRRAACLAAAGRIERQRR
jgi:hypothetical protein